MCKGIIRKEGKKRIESRHPSRLIHWIFHLFYFNSNFSFLSLCLSLFIKTKHPFSRVEELLEEVESSSRHPSDPLCWGSAVDPARKPKILHAGIDNLRLPRLLHRSRDSSARERGKRPSANACLRIHHREPRSVVVAHRNLMKEGQITFSSISNFSNVSNPLWRKFNNWVKLSYFRTIYCSKHRNNNWQTVEIMKGSSIIDKCMDKCYSSHFNEF